MGALERQMAKGLRALGESRVKQLEEPNFQIGEIQQNQEPRSCLEGICHWVIAKLDRILAPLRKEGVEDDESDFENRRDNQREVEGTLHEGDEGNKLEDENQDARRTFPLVSPQLR